MAVGCQHLFPHINVVVLFSCRLFLPALPTLISMPIKSTCTQIYKCQFANVMYNFVYSYYHSDTVNTENNMVDVCNLSAQSFFQSLWLLWFKCCSLFRKKTMHYPDVSQSLIMGPVMISTVYKWLSYAIFCTFHPVVCSRCLAYLLSFCGVQQQPRLVSVTSDYHATRSMPNIAKCICSHIYLWWSLSVEALYTSIYRELGYCLYTLHCIYRIKKPWYMWRMPDMVNSCYFFI